MKEEYKEYLCPSLQCQSIFEQSKVMHYCELEFLLQEVVQAVACCMSEMADLAVNKYIFRFSVLNSKQNRPTVSVGCLTDCAQ